jgi:transposase
VFLCPCASSPGEAFQFDWGEDWAVIAGRRVKLQVAHTKLSFSRAFILRAYPLQTHEMLFDALTEAFRVLGGVPRRGIFDNMKTAVDRIGSGKARQVNLRFMALASHYLFETTFCNPAAGWEKGQIEKTVQDARRQIWQDLPAFPDLGALNAWLEARCLDCWERLQHIELARSIAEVHASERPHLMVPGASL